MKFIIVISFYLVFLHSTLLSAEQLPIKRHHNSGEDFYREKVKGEKDFRETVLWCLRYKEQCMTARRQESFEKCLKVAKSTVEDCAIKALKEN